MNKQNVVYLFSWYKVEGSADIFHNTNKPQ